MLLYKFISLDSTIPTGLCLLFGNKDRSIIAMLSTILVMVGQIGSVIVMPCFYFLLFKEKSKQEHNMEEMKYKPEKASSKSD